MRHDRNGTLWISRHKKQYSTLDTIKPTRNFIPRGSAPRDEKTAGFMVSGRNYYFHSDAEEGSFLFESLYVLTRKALDSSLFIGLLTSSEED
jgi:hypothetical protein